MATTKATKTASSSPKFTVPGLSGKDAHTITAELQRRLEALIDLNLTLKHIHWNVVGPTFIGVHTMLDPQVVGVTAMVDRIAERIATMGSAPNGLAGNLVKQRKWDDYALDRAMVSEHLGALDLVFNGVIEDHRDAIELISDTDPITEDILIQQTGELEQYQWFVRAHLESAAGQLSNEGAHTEQQAAELAGKASRKSARQR